MEKKLKEAQDLQKEIVGSDEVQTTFDSSFAEAAQETEGAEVKENE